MRLMKVRTPDTTGLTVPKLKEFTSLRTEVKKPVILYNNHKQEKCTCNYQAKEKYEDPLISRFW